MRHDAIKNPESINFYAPLMSIAQILADHVRCREQSTTKIGPIRENAPSDKASAFSRMKGFRKWKWHLDEGYVTVNGEMHYLWRTVDQEGEILESFIHEDAGQEAGAAFHEEGIEAPRLT